MFLFSFLCSDLATLSEAGLLKIVGRVKDLVIRGGENVYPTEIENVLHMCPIVAEAHVCGLPDERLGEEICGWIRLKRGEEVVQTEEYLRDHCKASVCTEEKSNFYVVNQAINSFPKTAEIDFIGLLVSK